MPGHGRLSETVLIGAVDTAMEDDKGRQARGEHYTPPGACHLMARMILGGGQVKEGARTGDPCAGAGGMIRAAAQVLRERHQDPAVMRWFANDVSPVSVAGLAVNLDLWDIGPHRRVLRVRGPGHQAPRAVAGRRPSADTQRGSRSCLQQIAARARYSQAEPAVTAAARRAPG